MLITCCALDHQGCEILACLDVSLKAKLCVTKLYCLRQRVKLAVDHHKVYGDARVVEAPARVSVQIDACVVYAGKLVGILIQQNVVAIGHLVNEPALLDQLLNGNKTPSPNGGGVSYPAVDRNIYFDVVLGYDTNLIIAEMEREGLSYGDKVVPPAELEVGQ